MSYFDGTLLQLIGYRILAFLITSISFGLLFPFAFTLVYSWKMKHTVINGRRLKFIGSGFQLIGNWILWMFLIIITLGIYSFWVGIAFEKWKVKNTVFE